MKIEYYKKIRRLLSTNKYNSSRMIFWKERLKKALKIKNTISWLQYEYIAITKETLSTLDFFIDSIYLPSITSKNNANPSSIKTSILKWINEDKSYSFLWLHINNILIWKNFVNIKHLSELSSFFVILGVHYIFNQYFYKISLFGYFMIVSRAYMSRGKSKSLWIYAMKLTISRPAQIRVTYESCDKNWRKRDHWYWYYQ